MQNSFNKNPYRFTPLVNWIILGICILPFLIKACGINFGIAQKSIYLSPGTIPTDDLFYSILTGAFLHTILEWSGVIIALMIAMLSFVHFSIKKDFVVPVIGIALFCAGLMDSFHILTADRIIQSAADNQDFSPFTWALSALFHITILLIGCSVILFGDIKNKIRLSQNKMVWGTSLIFGALAVSIMIIAAHSESIPQTIYPNSLIKRPWDVVPLVLMILGLYLFNRLNKEHPSYFSFGLLVSIIPSGFSELYMAFGSFSLFDHYFLTSHFLKIISYLVPFIGLLMDYIFTYKALIEKTRRMNLQNDELMQFSYVVSHDLKTPLRGISTLVEFLESDLKNDKSPSVQDSLTLLKERTQRLINLVDGILNFSKAGRTQSEKKWIKVSEALHYSMKILNPPQEVNIIFPENDYKIHSNIYEINEIFQNLIGNGIKFNDKPNPVIEISSKTLTPNFIEFRVSDNGPGIDEKYHEKIFKVFQKLDTDLHNANTGIGLSIVKKLIESNGGEIWVKNNEDSGVSFYFTWPILTKQILVD
jgi:signal transduction histidine kinase